MRFPLSLVYLQMFAKSVGASGYAACLADSLLSSGHSVGPATTLRRGKRCVQKINGRFEDNWDAAWQECEERGGVLPTILSAWELERLNEWGRTIADESTTHKTNPWTALMKQTDNTAGQLDQIAWMQTKLDPFPLTFDGQFNDMVAWTSVSLDINRKCGRWIRHSTSVNVDKIYFGECNMVNVLAGVFCQFYPSIITMDQVFKRTKGYIFNGTAAVLATEVQTENVCARLCAKEKYCSSFNVLNLDQPTNKQCQLLGANFRSTDLLSSLVSRADGAFWMFDG